jgi:uncharacterized NAD-dependent epimerase/dehydratase family protein
MESSAIVLTEGRYQSGDAKTAHGLVRGPSRWPIAAVIDASCAGTEAGEQLDGIRRGIPIYASVTEALARLPQRPQWCVVGVATHGGRFPESLRSSLREAARAGLGIVNGLHELASDDAELVALTQQHQQRIIDIRKPRPVRELAFWHGDGLKLTVPRVAVIGTDCALGKRTTTQFLVRECRRRGLRAEMIYTGQTGWMQGGRFGFVLDSTPNDFVPGEIERALLDCVRAEDPQIIFLEGQSALRNPSGPCGAELLLSAGARQVVLQHAPARLHYDGAEALGIRIPPLAEEIELLRYYQAQVVGVTINTEGLSVEQARAQAQSCEAQLQIPVVLPIQDGVGRIVDTWQR